MLRNPRKDKYLVMLFYLLCAATLSLLKIAFLSHPSGGCTSKAHLDSCWATPTSRLVKTDSTGIQQEISYLGILCLTVCKVQRASVTIAEGTNELC